jgi:putative transcriptional regulator
MSSRRLRFTLLCLSLLLALAAATLSAARVIPRKPGSPPVLVKAPDKGVLLVAARKMGDPRFRNTVVLLVQHGEDGSLGLIINRPTSILLSEALPDLKGANAAKHNVFFGGPVALNAMLFLVRSRTAPDNAQQVRTGIYVSGSRATLEHMLGQGSSENELRVYAGYAGWGAGQLDTEILRGDWYLCPADAGTIFNKDVEKLWTKLIDSQEPEGLMVRAKGGAVSG